MTKPKPHPKCSRCNEAKRRRIRDKLIIRKYYEANGMLSEQEVEAYLSAKARLEGGDDD